MKDFFLKKSFIDGRESWEVEVDHLSEGKQVYPMCGTSFIRCVTLLTDVSSALSLHVSLSPTRKRKNLKQNRRVVFLTKGSNFLIAHLQLSICRCDDTYSIMWLLLEEKIFSDWKSFGQ